jgi:hypothetical protein
MMFVSGFLVGIITTLVVAHMALQELDRKHVQELRRFREELEQARVELDIVRAFSGNGQDDLITELWLGEIYERSAN